MNKSEQAIHDTQQRHLREAWDKNLTPRCELIERRHIEHQTERRGLHRLASRSYPIVYEIPRRHTMNGYAFDV